MKRRTECRASAARNELESIRRAAHRKPQCRECAGARNRDPARQLARHAAAILARAENVRAVRTMEFHPRSHLAKNGHATFQKRTPSETFITGLIIYSITSWVFQSGIS